MAKNVGRWIAQDAMTVAHLEQRSLTTGHLGGALGGNGSSNTSGNGAGASQSGSTSSGAQSTSTAGSGSTPGATDSK